MKIILTTALIMAITLNTKAQKLIEVASFGQNQPIGVTVAPKTNRLFVSFPHTEPFLYGLTEIVNGNRVPYPNMEWNKYDPANADTHFVNVQEVC